MELVKERQGGEEDKEHPLLETEIVAAISIGPK